MAPSRAYIPSAALIRALARPQPLRCPLARPLPAQFVRGKKSKAAKAREAEKTRLAHDARRERHAAMTTEQQEAEAEKEAEEQIQQKMKKDKKFAAAAGPIGKLITEMKDPDKIDKYFEPPVFKEGEDPGIDFYELDLDTGKKRKVDRLGTVADQEREKETRAMIEESYSNPDYDDAELNKRLMDGLMANPAFADLTAELKEIKESIMTKEEQMKMEEDAEREAQPAIEEIDTAIRTAIHESVMQLANDPDVGDAKADLQAVLDKLSEISDVQDPDFQALMDRATEKVNNNAKLQAKLNAASENETPEEKAQWADFEKEVEELTAPEEEDQGEDLDVLDEDEINKLMLEMRDVLKTLNIEGDLDKELDKMLSESTVDMSQAEDENGVNFDEDTDPTELAAALTRLAERKMKTAPKSNEEEEEHIPPELQAKVDKIMADPRLMEKLSHIQKLIAEHTPARDPNDLTQIDTDLAPDPYEMDDSRTATLAQRMAAARADPHHAAALRNLRIKLPPPYTISPALKSFNQALEFAYVGANDDVRRVLWRSYQKARTLPTFLQNMNDDAWDILYYSQAVTWTGNQNRGDHLKLLLADLASVGRSGPPTHPSALGQHQEAARLEAAQREAEMESV